MVCHRRLSDSKFQVYRNLLDILADLNNPVVWMVSIRPPISSSSSPISKPLWTVPSVPITTSITVTFRFRRFLVLYWGTSTCLSFHFLWFSLCCLLRRLSPLQCKLLLLSSLLLLLLFTPLEFFTSVLADGFSLEFEWQQVSSSLQNWSQDSSRS